MQQPHFASQITQAYSVYVNPYGMRRLSPGFQPGSFDVLCARGKLAYDHEGNKRFRALVKQHQKQYSAATCKYEKSKIVSFIVSAVRNASPQGGFVKNIDGAWFEVGDRHAKEKVGQTFRDLLHNKYSSSTKAKARARLQKRRKSEPEQMEEEEAEGKQQPQKKRKSAPKPPQAVTSRSPISGADDVRSSVSVVSENSMETDGADNTTLHHHNYTTNPDQEMPPLRSVVVTKKKTNKGSSNQIVTPPQAQRVASLNLMDTLRSSIQTFDGRDSTGTRPPFLQHPGAPFGSSYASAGAIASTRSGPMMEVAVSDMEPLPLGQGATVKVDFNESNSSMQSEQSFEDVMSEFCQNMSVPV